LANSLRYWYNAGVKNETLIFGAALTVVSCWAGDALPDHRYLTLDARQAKIVQAKGEAAALKEREWPLKVEAADILVEKTLEN